MISVECLVRRDPRLIPYDGIKKNLNSLTLCTEAKEKLIFLCDDKKKFSERTSRLSEKQAIFIFTFCDTKSGALLL
jgi:hypothetical protein